MRIARNHVTPAVLRSRVPPRALATRATKRSKDRIGRELEKASDLFLSNKLPHSLKIARAVAKIDPNNYWAYVLLGHVLADAGKLRSARKHYEQAIALKPRKHSAYEAKANVLLECGLYEEAEHCARTALRLAAVRGPLRQSERELIYDTLVDSLVGQGKCGEALIVVRDARKTMRSKLLQCREQQIRKHIRKLRGK